MKIQPLGERVLVKAPKLITKEKTEGGIIVPNLGGDVHRRSKVVAIGKLVESVEVGDVIAYSEFGTDFKDGDEIFVIVEEKDILAIITEEK